MKTNYLPVVLLMLLCVAVSHSCTNYYINPTTGNDNWDGLSPTHASGTNGPKASMQAAVDCASADDILNLSDCVYNESVTLGKNLGLTCSFMATLRDLTVMNNSTLSIGGPVVITGTLVLDDGTIVNSEHNVVVVLNPSAAAVRIATGSINGTIVRIVASNSTDSYLFTDAHTMIIPDGNQHTCAVLVSSFPGQQAPQMTGQAINRYYSVETFGQLRGSICLSYAESELNGITEETLISLQMTPDNPQWTEAGGALDASENYIEVPDVSLNSCSKWTLGQAAHSLPIQLASFSAVVVEGNSVEVAWRTLTETNNFGFYIQRRTAASTTFEDLPNSFVSGHGTTIEAHDYRWIHPGVAPGQYAYRLKQVDLDGTSHYSDERLVEISSLAGIEESHIPVEFNLAQNYPNPFNPSTNIRFTVDKAGFTSLAVFDVLGKELGTLYSGVAEPGRVYATSFDASTLANGTYFYKLVNGSRTSLKKMLLLK